MKIWVTTDEAGRIVSAVTMEKCAVGMTEAELPDGVTIENLGDYRFIDGAFSYTGEATAAREEAEKQAQAAAEEREKLDSASREYFLDGGKEFMEQDIRDAASVNEYIDALLGLDATNETEATDAE